MSIYQETHIRLGRLLERFVSGLMCFLLAASIGAMVMVLYLKPDISLTVEAIFSFAAGTICFVWIFVDTPR